MSRPSPVLVDTQRELESAVRNQKVDQKINQRYNTANQSGENVKYET